MKYKEYLIPPYQEKTYIRNMLRDFCSIAETKHLTYKKYMNRLKSYAQKRTTNPEKRKATLSILELSKIQEKTEFIETIKDLQGKQFESFHDLNVMLDDFFLEY